MTERTQVSDRTDTLRTVGQVARELGVTVRTLHHYDAIGLLTPTERSYAGYRQYTAADLERLQNIVVYRRLGFSLEDIGPLLDADGRTVADHLRRQREAVMSRLDELSGLVTAIDRALEKEMSNEQMTPQDMRELFGDSFDDAQQEAEERWGDSEAWKESQRRTSRYTKADWEQVKVETDALGRAFVDAKRSGSAPDSEAAMDAAEAHRRHIDERFYACSYAMHRNLGELYVSDPRYTESYDGALGEPGLSAYVRDAIDANATRHGA